MLSYKVQQYYRKRGIYTVKMNIPKGQEFHTISDLIYALDGRIMKVEQDNDIWIIYACIQTSADDNHAKMKQDICNSNKV